MSIAKMSGGSALPNGLPIGLSGGEYFILPTGQGVQGTFGATTFPQIASGNVLSGQYLIDLGLYSVLQVYDSALNYWRTVASGGPNHQLYGVAPADGYNFRLLNPTGCPIGALITAAGSTGTNGFYGFQQFGPGQGQAVVIQNGQIVSLGSNLVFTITPSAGGSQWNAIIGGAVNTTLSFSGTVFQSAGGQLSPFGGTGSPLTGSGGANYTKPPIIVFTPPPNQGLQPYLLPTAVATISGGAVNAVTVTNQGAGLLGLPGITVIPQPGDTTGGGAVLGWTSGNSAQVGSGTLLAMWPAYYGTPQTAAITFTFAGTSNPAPTVTAIMNFSVTSITNTTPGVGYTNAYGVWQGGIVAGSAANTNPILDKFLSPVPNYPPISVVAGTGVTTLASGYGGSGFTAAPTLAFGTQLAAGTVTTVAVQTPVLGGNNDTIQLFSI